MKLKIKYISIIALFISFQSFSLENKKCEDKETIKKNKLELIGESKNIYLLRDNSGRKLNVKLILNDKHKYNYGKMDE